MDLQHTHGNLKGCGFLRQLLMSWILLIPCNNFIETVCWTACSSMPPLRNGRRSHHRGYVLSRISEVHTQIDKSRVQAAVKLSKRCFDHADGRWSRSFSFVRIPRYGCILRHQWLNFQTPHRRMWRHIKKMGSESQPHVNGRAAKIEDRKIVC